ncbi:MAG TPA: IclR family transcriptional regulator [Candidatus Lustribacter sp.]
MTDHDGVASVERALSVLDAFRSEDTSLSLAALAARTGLYKSTILRLLATLERFGYVTRRVDGNYRVGPAALRLAALYQRTTQPAERILPILTGLVDATRESASFTVRNGNSAVCIYRVDSPQMVRDHVKPGDAHPIDRGASGRAILAFTHPYPARLAAVRHDGVALALGEVTPDFASIAAPVFDVTGKVAGSISISGPSTRFPKVTTNRMRLLLIDAARSVTLGLGGDAAPVPTESHRASRAKPRAAARSPRRS